MLAWQTWTSTSPWSRTYGVSQPALNASKEGARCHVKRQKPLVKTWPDVFYISSIEREWEICRSGYKTQKCWSTAEASWFPIACTSPRAGYELRTTAKGLVAGFSLHKKENFFFSFLVFCRVGTLTKSEHCNNISYLCLKGKLCI